MNANLFETHGADKDDLRYRGNIDLPFCPAVGAHIRHAQIPERGGGPIESTLYAVLYTEYDTATKTMFVVVSRALPFNCENPPPF